MLLVPDLRHMHVEELLYFHGLSCFLSPFFFCTVVIVILLASRLLFHHKLNLNKLPI